MADLASPPDLQPPSDLKPAVATYILQPGPGVGKDTGWGTVYAVNGSPDAPALDVGGWGDWYYDYFEFDLSGTPSADQTMQASLEFYFSVSVNDPGLEIHRILQPWTANGVTRASHPDATLYKPFGGRVVPAGTYSVDITDLYKAWKNGTYPNYGIELVPQRNDQTNGVVAASENPDATHRPKLTVVYHNP